MIQTPANVYKKVALAVIQRALDDVRMYEAGWPEKGLTEEEYLSAKGFLRGSFMFDFYCDLAGADDGLKERFMERAKTPAKTRQRLLFVPVCK